MLSLYFQSPLLKYKWPPKYPSSHGSKGRLYLTFVLRLIESSLNQRNSRYAFEVYFICFCLVLVFFLYTVVREHRVCYAENNRNNEKSEKKERETEAR